MDEQTVIITILHREGKWVRVKLEEEVRKKQVSAYDIQVALVTDQELILEIRVLIR